MVFRLGSGRTGNAEIQPPAQLIYRATQCVAGHTFASGPGELIPVRDRRRPEPVR